MDTKKKWKRSKGGKEEGEKEKKEKKEEGMGEGKGREREGGGERRFYFAFGSLRLLFHKG